MADIEPVTPAQSTPVIVTLPAEIDMANDRGVSSQLGCAPATGTMIVIADMTGTRFCDSTGLRVGASAQAGRCATPNCGW